MEIFPRALEYAFSHRAQFLTALTEHLLLVLVPLAIGGTIGLLLGFCSSRSAWAATVFINGFNGLRVIPSLAILFIAIPYFGLTFLSAAIALTLLVIPPILIATDAALRGIPPAILEAARGMGMSPRQILVRVEIPLALPAIVAGIETATIEAIASAALAAFIGAGGLGRFIVLGFALYDNAILLVGAVPVALLAWVAAIGSSRLQKTLATRNSSLTLGSHNSLASP